MDYEEQENNIEEEIKKYSKEFFIKKIKCFFKSIILNINCIMILAGILTGFILGIFIIGIGGFAVLIKMVFVIIAAIVSFVVICDNISADEYVKAFQQACLYVLISLLFLEGCLYCNSNYEKIIPIKVVVSDESFEVENRSGKTVPNLTIPYKIVSYYNLNNNDRIDYKIIESYDEHLIPWLSSVTQQKIFIQYTPFLMYSKQKVYERIGTTND